MTDEQKEDLQFWFYTRIFVDRQPPLAALEDAAREVSAPLETALDYLVSDGRVQHSGMDLTLRTFQEDEADPRGVYVDIEWMLQILHRAGLSGDILWNALGSIYKIPPSVAREEASQIAIVEGE